MRIPGVKTAKKFSRWLQARMLGGALILGYHRIHASTSDGYDISVSPENFAEHLSVLQKYTRPIALSVLVQHLRAGSIPKKSVAVTFDDGYVDNLRHARPLLEKYDVPATVFVCTGYMGREFWWDELDRLIRSSPSEPYAFHLQLGKKLFRWDQIKGRPESGPPKVRGQFRQALYHFMLSLAAEDQERVLDVVRNWAGMPSLEDPATRSMDQDEILQLAEGGLIEIGAHTRHHPMLAELSIPEQKYEIATSKKDLEDLLGKSIAGFAYPNGMVTPRAKQFVREAGYAYACTSLHDVVRPRSDFFELTRFWQKDVKGDKFMEVLNGWMKIV
jgi:peptidoglycan/xylan/chitin deacetylase (PgdA/CDA1 family)